MLEVTDRQMQSQLRTIRSLELAEANIREEHNEQITNQGSNFKQLAKRVAQTTENTQKQNAGTRAKM